MWEAQLVFQNEANRNPLLSIWFDVVMFD